MSAFEELMQSYVNRDYKELLEIAKHSFAEIRPYLATTANEIEDASVSKLLVAIIGTCIGTDDQLTPLEISFVKDITGQDADFTSEIASYYNDEASRDFVDALFDNCPRDIKPAFFAFCVSFLAVDERISREEVSFIRRLLD